MNFIFKWLKLLRIVWKLGIRNSFFQILGTLTSEIERVEKIYGITSGSLEPRGRSNPRSKASSQSLSVLILYNVVEDDVLYRYRVKQKMEQLSSVGIKTEPMRLEATHLLSETMKSHTHLIIYRLPQTGFLEELLEKGKANGIKLIYDIDDFIFDPHHCHEIEGFRNLNPSEKKDYLSKMSQISKAIQLCQSGLVPTTLLQCKLKEMGLTTHLHRNGIEKEMVDISERALKGKVEKNIIAIAYMSGTNTHNRDFQLCTPALADILRRYDHVKLYIFGWLTLDPSLQSFENKVVRIPYMPWRELVVYAKDMDIQICPLEDNAFCNSKSELKYLEAALLGQPIIVSPRTSFKEVIIHGVNGYLAETKEEWIHCLDLLINHRDIREAVGQRARGHILREYDIKKMGTDLADFLKSL